MGFFEDMLLAGAASSDPGQSIRQLQQKAAQDRQLRKQQFRDIEQVKADQERIAKNRSSAEASAFEPLESPWQVAAKLAQAGVSAFKESKLNNESKAVQSDFTKQWESLNNGGLSTEKVDVKPNGPVVDTKTTQGSLSPDFVTAGLVQRGLPEHVAQGVVANLKDESGLNPGINEANPLVKGSRGGFGLAQWTGPRRREIEAYAKERGANVADPNVQLDFLVHELGTSEKKAGDKLLASKNANEAAQTFLTGFLRPAQEHQNSRSAKYARALANPDKPYVDPVRVAPREQQMAMALNGKPVPSNLPARTQLDYGPGSEQGDMGFAVDAAGRDLNPAPDQSKPVTDPRFPLNQETLDNLMKADRVPTEIDVPVPVEGAPQAPDARRPGSPVGPRGGQGYVPDQLDQLAPAEQGDGQPPAGMMSPIPTGRPSNDQVPVWDQLAQAGLQNESQLEGGVPVWARGNQNFPAAPGAEQNAFPAAPAAPEQRQASPAATQGAAISDRINQLYALYRHPGATDRDREIIGMQVKKLEAEQKKIEEANAPVVDEWTRLNDTTAFNKRTGETKNLVGKNEANPDAPFRFKGNSTEAQALNGLMDSGSLTPDQAQQLAAGKTITDPATGAVTFLTPKGVFQQPQGSQAPVPMGTEGQKEAAAAAPVPTGNGGIIPLTGARPDKLTETQGKAATFTDRLLESDPIIDRLGNVGTDYKQQGLASVPLAGNSLVSNDYQQLQQAQRNFLNAVLRKESGAVISDEEFANGAKQYFPQPGDSPETIAQKSANRKTAISGMQREAGHSYKPASAPSSGGPKAGSVEDGYRFKGGDPADPSNWEEVR